MFKPLQLLDHIDPENVIRFSFKNTPITAKVIKVDWFKKDNIQTLAIWCHKLDPLFALETWPNNHDRIVSFAEQSGIEIETDSVLVHLTNKKQNLENQLQETNLLIEYYQS